MCVNDVHGEAVIFWSPQQKSFNLWKIRDLNFPLDIIIIEWVMVLYDVH